MVDFITEDNQEEFIKRKMKMYKNGNGTLSSLRYSKLSDEELYEVCKSECKIDTIVFGPYIPPQRL